MRQWDYEARWWCMQNAWLLFRDFTGYVITRSRLCNIIKVPLPGPYSSTLIDMWLTQWRGRKRKNRAVKGGLRSWETTVSRSKFPSNVCGKINHPLETDTLMLDRPQATDIDHEKMEEWKRKRWSFGANSLPLKFGCHAKLPYIYFYIAFNALLTPYLLNYKLKSNCLNKLINWVQSFTNNLTTADQARNN